jgi:hypothetical protein
MSKEYSPQETPPEMQNRVTYKVVTVANPAPGADFQAIVPAGKMWDSIAVHFHLATAVAVATRVAKVTISDGVTMFAETRAGATQAASLTYEYTFAPNMQALAEQGLVVGGAMPKVVLNAGAIISSEVYLLQAADQISNIALYVREIDIS